MRYVAPGHNLELTLEVNLEHVLRIKTITLIFNPRSHSKAYLYLRMSTGEKVMILFLSHSLGIVIRTEQDLIACSAILHL